VRAFRQLSDIAWRGLVITIAVLAISYALIRLKVVVVPLGIALLFATFLTPAVAALERRGIRRGLATAFVFVGFISLLVLIGLGIAPGIGRQFGDLGETVAQGVDDIEEWLVTGPIGLTPDQVETYRESLNENVRNILASSGDQLIAGAVIVAEALAGTLLTILAAIFIVKDGPKMQAWFLAHLPVDRRELVAACGARAWTALGGFLRGAAIIGVVEGIIMAVALAIVGADLALPVGVLTFFAAFFPVLGAIAAGVIATLVALVSGGFADAVVIAIVALVVQQFDNDLLAPVIYGRALRLHPLVVVSALTAGATLGGIIGAFLAVPLTAVVVAVSGELWARREIADAGG
jgi:predicted PurR-regulated permease PerM